MKLIRGRVWGFDTKKPLTDATIHIWQANHAGRYDNDDRRRPPRKGVFRYRARMLTDELGRYEYENVKSRRDDDANRVIVSMVMLLRANVKLVVEANFELDDEHSSGNTRDTVMLALDIAL